MRINNANKAFITVLFVKKALFVFSLYFLLISELNGQTYKAIYECVYSANTENQKRTNDTSNITFGFPIAMRIIYTIYTDGKYLEIEGELKDATSIPGADIRFKKSAERAIVYIKKELIYFPDEKLLKKIKVYQIETSSDTFPQSGFQISGNGSVRINFNKEFPSYITPGLFINNNKSIGAISLIKTARMTIQLINCLVIKNKKLDYEKIFKTLTEDKVQGYFDFLE